MPDVREYAVADVFTDVPLEGNALAVFVDGSGLSDEQMQRVARELNLSETVFVLRGVGAGGGSEEVPIRIFTPGTELPFAGHPVLGTAFVLGARVESPMIRLRTRAGVVPVSLTRANGEVVFGEMEQPIPSIEPFARVDELLRALGISHSGLPVEAYSNGPIHVYVELDSEEALRSLQPDLVALTALGPIGVGCFTSAGTRVKSRNFAPALGVPEDPATGSAAGPLAVHLARHGRIEFGEEIEIRQGVEIGRPSLLRARVDGAADEIRRVVVGGSAVVVARGEYRLA